MLKRRLSLLTGIILQFLAISFLVRLSLFIWASTDISFSLTHIVSVFGTGLFFDFGVISFFTFIYALYLLVWPNRWVGSKVERISTYSYFWLTTLIIIFAFFAEFTFWEEFQSRFNFIAVDYLVYTNEVVSNINESYPLPLLFAGILLICLLIFYIQKKSNTFNAAFSHKTSGKERIALVGVLVLPLLYTTFVKNTWAEWSDNRYENELSKAGIYSFFSAFRNNELSYADFYKTQDVAYSFKLVDDELMQTNDSLVSEPVFSIHRLIKGKSEERKPNVVCICIESLSADFLAEYGNTKHLTPNLDSLLQHSVSFERLFATGTRTVRGMEAISLSVPPSPGRSIVKRKNNGNMHSIGEVFANKGYHCTFFYGGDGYFDNMNEFFGGNGFDIVDRGRGYLPGDTFTAKRSNIEDEEVSFENAWGICDEDIFNRVIKEADKHGQEGKPFFNFIMTTSNHRPYTYPENKIDIPSGTGRDGAVKYTDFAIGDFIKHARQKPWFSNTVFIVLADHCASSAGKWELNVGKYHIPAIIYNLPETEPRKINTLCSQIDVLPTLFGFLNWNYDSYFYGEDVTKMDENQGRAFIGNYRKLGLLKDHHLAILGDGKKMNIYNWDENTNNLSPDTTQFIGNEIIAYYQTCDYLYHHNLMKQTTTAQLHATR